jgi:hypothetical protein
VPRSAIANSPTGVIGWRGARAARGWIAESFALLRNSSQRCGSIAAVAAAGEAHGARQVLDAIALLQRLRGRM